MPSQQGQKLSIVGRRLRERREALGLAQEKVGIAIGLDESCARARISRYVLGVHEPPLNTVKRLAVALQVSVAYLYCEDENIARLLLSLYALPAYQREERIRAFQSLLPSLPVQEDACGK
jgi:transcriptional regulator with XRE-family HTH domain